MTSQNEISEAYSFLSDMHKEAYGFRCRTYRDDLTLEEIDVEIENLSVIVEANMKLEEAHEIASLEAFQVLVAKTIVLGASDEKTALNWIFDGYTGGKDVMDIDYFDFESMLYHYGIMHTDYAKYVLEVIKQPYMNYKA